MSKKGLKVGSVTLAMKGKDLLQKNGYKTYLTRNLQPEKTEGCGYILYINNFDLKALHVLENNGIKILGEVEGVK